MSGGTINAGQLAVGANAQIQTVYQSAPTAVTKQEFHPPVKVLFLAANPLNTERLRIDREIRSIDQALRSAQLRDAFELHQQWATRVADLQSHFLRYQPTIVHFSGHGNETCELLLEDNHGYAKAIPQQALSSLFAVLRGNTRCVLLNACFSDQQAMAIAEHIDCVIGMTSAVGDDAAIAFSVAFYQALGYGQSVQRAFELGKIQVDLEGVGNQALPQLLSKRNPDELFL